MRSLSSSLKDNVVP